MWNKWLFLCGIIICSSFISCMSDSELLNFQILSPKSDWTYYENQKISLFIDDCRDDRISNFPDIMSKGR